MNVLLISFSFPPAGGVGVLRALSLAKYLPEEDIRVDVLCARNAPSVGRDQSLLAQVPASVTVHRTWTLDLPFALRKGVKKLLSRPSAAPAKVDDTASATAPAKPGMLGRIKGFVANLLLPDPQIGWLPFAYPAAKHIIRSRNIHAVIITVPPFSSVHLATRLRRIFRNLPIIVDFRDEWLDTTLGLVSFNNNQRARDVARRTEARAVLAATHVVAVTNNAVDALRARYQRVPADRFLCIPNGFDGAQSPPQQPQRNGGNGDRVTLTYMGSVYGSTDPRTFLDALASLPAEIRAKLRVRFIGRVETESLRSALLALGDVVELVGFLPQDQALQQLRASDYALLILHDPINVSAKLYDYLGAGKPIIACVRPEGEARRLIDATRGGVWADINDTDGIQQMLTDAVQGTTAFDPATEVIAQFHRKPLAHRYAELLKGLA